MCKTLMHARSSVVKRPSQMHYGTDVRLFCVLADNIDNVMLDIGVG